MRSAVFAVGELICQPVAALSGARLQYNLQNTPYGEICFAKHNDALVFVGFTARAADILDPIRRHWPIRTCVRQDNLALDFAAPPPLHLHGTPYQHQVWRTLFKLKAGQTTCYSELAEKLNSGARAIGGAVGANPIAWLVPCHRVLQKSGALGGYRWGLSIKRRLLAAENITTQEFPY
jgi:AraC family transcriptional regulator of adaptative response/methylated-DNA-[protein]-cysteine methyltransferase